MNEDSGLLLVHIVGEELPGVVPGDPHGHLGQVVGAEGEKLGDLGDPVRQEGGPGNFDHGAHHVGECHPLLGDHGIGDLAGSLLKDLKLFLVDGQRDHDLRMDLHSGLGADAGGFDDGADLHVQNLRIGDGQTTASVSEHGVGLVKLLHPEFDLLKGDADLVGQLTLFILHMGNELMQGGVDEADRDGETVHGLEDSGEVVPLEGKKLIQRGDSLLHVVGDDHLLDGQAAFLGIEEHVLGPAEAYPFGAQLDGLTGIVGRVGVGPDPEAADLVGPLEKGLKLLAGFGFDQLETADEDFAGGSVQSEGIALLDDLLSHLETPLLIIHIHLLATDDAALPPTPGDDGGVGGLSPCGGENTLGGVHPPDVFGRGLFPDEDNAHAFGGHSLRVFGVEGHLTGSGAGNRVDTADQVALLQLILLGGIDDGVEDALDVLILDSQDGVLFGDQTLFHHVHGHSEGGPGKAFPGAALEHVELPLFHGELEVLHVLVVLLQGGPNLAELFVSGGVDLVELGELHGRTDSGDHVLSLGVDQVVSVEEVLSGVGVSGEADTGSALLAHVTEDHLLNVNGGAHDAFDVLDPSVGDGLIGHPGAEDGVHGAPELDHRILGEVGADGLLVDLLVLGDQKREFLLVNVGVVDLRADRHAEALPGVGLLDLVKGFVKIFSGDSHSRGAVHGDETTVGVHGKAPVSGLFGKTLHGAVVQTEVQNGFHHAGHGDGSPGTHGDEQRIRGIAETFTYGLLQFGYILGNLFSEAVRIFSLILIKEVANLCRNREARGNRKSDAGHLGQTGSLSTEQVLQRRVAFGLPTAEEVTMLSHIFPPFPISRVDFPPLRFFFTNSVSSIRAKGLESKGILFSFRKALISSE